MASKPTVPSRDAAPSDRPRPCGWGLLATSQWDGEIEHRMGGPFTGGRSTSSTQDLHLCLQPHLPPGSGNRGPTP